MAETVIVDANNPANGMKVNSDGSINTSGGGSFTNDGTFAKESGGHLAAIDTATAASKTDLDNLVTNTTGLATQATLASAKTDLDTIVTNTTGVATAANQSTANTSLSSIKTDLDEIATDTDNLAGMKTDLDTLAGVVSGSKAAVKAGSGDFVAGSIADLATLLADIVAVISGGKVLTTETNSASILSDLATLAGAISSSKMQDNIAQVAGNNIAPGNNAVPILNSAAAGFVAAYGSNAAALTSNTDYVFKWGAGGTTQVNKVKIFNGTTINILYEESDTATNAGSPYLIPGQTLYFDVQTAAVHLQGAGTNNVNGSTSGNVVVRGWL